MEIQENPTNGTRDTAELLLFSNKVPLVIDRSQPNVQSL